MELWKTNNLFKVFLLCFIVAFLTLILFFHAIAASRYLLLVLLGGVASYVAFLLFPLLKRPGHAQTLRQGGRMPSKTTILAAVLLVLVFVTALIVIRTITAPAPGYQLVGLQQFVLQNGTALSMTPIKPNNECAWLESMNITTQQIAKQQNLPDCDYAWPHINLNTPTLFVEFENYTEFVYGLTSASSHLGLAGIEVLCFAVPSQSFQCWVPPATVSHLR